MQFFLTIDLDSDDVSTFAGIAAQLRKLAANLSQEIPVTDGADRGRTLDANGNTVGEWRIS